jgi:SAM-dependent methyltransferase
MRPFFCFYKMGEIEILDKDKSIFNTKKLVFFKKHRPCIQIQNYMNQYFSGEKLYGDDFSLAEIKKWFDDETEGYADLGSSDSENYDYVYHHLNQKHGFRFLKDYSKFESVLGIGAAYGHEFMPILDKIENLTILEPSEQLVSVTLKGTKPDYVKPNISGEMPFSDEKFDLVTSFGTLHHVPNVSFVMSEIHRCLEKGGLFLFREPIISMGDWREKRPGLTSRERGIPINIFRKIIKDLNFEVIHEGLCMTATPFLERNIGKRLPKPLKSYSTYIEIDAILAKIFAGNIHYHAKTAIQRIAPTNVFYVLRK